MVFSAPFVNLHVEDVRRARQFYEQLGFVLTYTAVIDGEEVHYELVLDGFTLGLSAKTSAVREHGLRPGKNSGAEIVFYVDDVDQAFDF